MLACRPMNGPAIHVAFPADSVVHGWLAGTDSPRCDDPSRAAVIVFSPATAGAEEISGSAARAGQRAVACLPVLRADGWFVAAGAESYGNVRADAYASDEATLRAALRFVTAEEREARTQGPFRMTWLGPLGELNLHEPPIGRSFPIDTAGVTGDPARLRQLVTILVDNAIRHSPRGRQVGVTVRSANGIASIEVTDEGPGIRPDDMAHVFDRFWRASGAPSGGTGLGLAIAKWIVDRHRGTITVSNRETGGAQFRVRLPSLEAAPA